MLLLLLYYYVIIYLYKDLTLDTCLSVAQFIFEKLYYSIITDICGRENY